ncbi:hypothetical protein Rhal01_00536 [Rubritalea halochordaticola]|uniref:Sulfatase N-terminal domain-containing protein n=1 Tax=Rubritalea halochordaticola TaxID=714537 RepID=A0ABP9UZW2_9BACT
MKITTQILAALALTSLFSLAADRPNFLWIVSEDNSKHHTKHFDPTGVAMPNLEQLAKEGVTFDNACSNGAVCSVARSTLVTGCYAPKLGAQFHRRQKLVPMPAGLKAFPAYLKEAGYYTANKTKTDYNLQVNMKETWSAKDGWKGKAEGQPFFLQQNFAGTHEGSSHFPLNAMKKKPLKDLISNITLPPHHPDTILFRYSYASYQDRLRKFDEQLGNLIDQLKKDGLYEDTIIFYFGDHGGVLPRSKGYAYETGLAAPMVVRVPEKWQHLIPFKPGTRTDAIVNFYDFGPSIIHAAGIPLSDQFDGKPFLGKDISAEELSKRVAYGYADRFDEKYDLVRTYRKGDLKYMRNFQPFNPDALHNFYRYKQLAYLELRELHKAGKLNAQQELFFSKKPAEALYDLKNDPYELNNLAGDPKYQDTLKEMRSTLTKHLKEMNDLSFYPESELINKAFGNPTAFGKKHSKEIAALIDLANLEVVNFDEAKSKIESALIAEDVWTRYWACIVATSFYEKAKPLEVTLSTIANSDANILVRVRAAEALAHLGNSKAKEVIEKAIYASTDPVELNLILNSAAMLYELDPTTYTFDIDKSKLNTNSSLVKERIIYLNKRD